MAKQGHRNEEKIILVHLEAYLLCAANMDEKALHHHHLHKIL